MSNTFQIPAQFNKPVFRADRSVTLMFETRELNGLEAAILMDMRQNEGWLLFSLNKEQLEKIPEEKADPGLRTKTQAQRIRAVIYRIWEKNGSNGDFESYYRTTTEKMLDQLKEKLDD